MNKTTFKTDQNKLTVSRTFDAPLNLVWRAWTEPDLLDQWWAPKPWKSRTKTMNFREGGYRLYAMVGPENEEHWGRTDYESIIRHQSFAGKDSFCDEFGNINISFPVAQFQNEFSEKEDQTEVFITTVYETRTDLEKVLEMGMEEGLKAALDNLDTVLKRLSTSKGQ